MAITRSIGMRATLVVALLAAVAAAAFVGTRIAGATPGSDPAFVPHAEACVNKWFGTIRVKTLTAPTCSSAAERSLLIASEEKVDEVARTYVKTSVSNSGNGTTTSTANYADVSVSCDNDDIATGGGAWLDVGNPGNTVAGDNVALQASYPRVDGANPNDYEQANGWRAFARELQNIPADADPVTKAEDADGHTPVEGFYGTQKTWGNFSGAEATYTSATSAPWNLHVYVICRGNDIAAD
ncbi:MAG: hypothetical protein R3B59_04585 [Dehalococcoidia bacterium]